MTVSSDLDLLVIYEASGSALSNSKRPISAPIYFARLAQTMVSWLSTATAEGVLYPVDLRLRPEGKAGSIATSLDRLKTYFVHDAWVWEKLALTKARFIAGDKCLKKNLNLTIHEIVNQPHQRKVIVSAVSGMLNRIRKTQKKKSAWHLRLRDGGLVDLDLLIQAMRLEHGNLFENTGQSPSDILERLLAFKEIKTSDSTELLDATSVLNDIHQFMRLTFGDATHVTNHLPPRLLTFMLIQMDLADENQLSILLEKSIDQVRKQMLAYIRMKK